MKNEPSDEKLRQLLALKKHEVPPPGFHEQLRGRILEQIEEEASKKGFLAWIRRQLPEFEMSPAMLGTAGAAACVLFLVALSPTDDAPTQNHPEVAVTEPNPEILPPMGIELADHTLLATNSSPTSAPPFLFDTPSLKTERAGFNQE